MNAVRICYLANASSVHTHRWIKYFVERGHEVHVISFENAELAGAIVHVLKLPLLVRSATFPLKIASVYRIRALIKRIEPDILHAHYITNYGLFGALCNFHPFVATSWGSDILSVETESPAIGWIKKFIALYVARKTDNVTVDSKSLLEKVAGLGVPPEKIKLILHGASLNEFGAHLISLKFRRNLAIASDAKIAISTRRLEPLYDVETLVKAIPYVIKNYPNVHFIILGGGTQKRQLQEMARQLKAERCISFIGEAPHEKVARFLANSDVYVSTSLSDSTSVSLLEAMASRLPVIVTDIEGNREWVKNGLNGFLIPPRKPQALAGKLLQLLGNDELIKKFGLANRGIVEKRGSYEREMTKMEEIYARLKIEYHNKNADL